MEPERWLKVTQKGAGNVKMNSSIWTTLMERKRQVMRNRTPEERFRGIPLTTERIKYRPKNENL